jgi:hypothetical protein
MLTLGAGADGERWWSREDYQSSIALVLPRDHAVPPPSGDVRRTAPERTVFVSASNAEPIATLSPTAAFTIGRRAAVATGGSNPDLHVFAGWATAIAARSVRALGSRGAL